MRLDQRNAVFEVSVRELAYRGETRLRATSFGRLRAELGQAIHEQYRRERHRNDGGLVESEVPVRLEESRGELRVIVRGRADVVVREKDGWVVEEVKSICGANERTAEALASASLQARAYALALERQGRPLAGVRLVLIALAGGDPERVPIAYQRAETEAELAAALDACLAEAREEAAGAERRRALAADLVFPHPDPRPGQLALVDEIDESLRRKQPVMLEAPTGTGKTVVALFAALRESLRQGRGVWYLTAKTTQRQAVLATFEAIARASGLEDALRAVALRRKEAMCPPGDLRCDPERCPFLRDFDARATPALEELGRPGARSADEIFALGTARELCPYELMHRVAAAADLAVGDYNHVYDERRRRASAPQRLVIVDEAHNLVDRARGYASVFVAKRALGAVARADGVSGLAPLAQQAKEAIDAALARAAEEEREGHDGAAAAELDGELWGELGLEAALLALRLAHERQARGAIDPNDPALEALEAIARLGELASEAEHDAALVPYVASPAAASGAGVGVICLDPARRLARLHRRSLGLVAMSATLSPLSYYADVLGLSRLAPRFIRAPSPFAAERRCVCIVPTICTTAALRNDTAPAIAALVAGIAALEPGNYAVFFSSFQHLALVQTRLRTGSMRVLAQPPRADEGLRAQILETLRGADRPTLLLAVSGGIFGEGIDLVGDALIGVIVVGPSLPAASFERRLMQAHHEEEREAGFAYAMAYPGMQRVIQAAGRVHRTANDRGIIVLLGARFAEPPFYEAIPAHWYDHDPSELFCDDPLPRLRAFWQSAPRARKRA